MTNTHAPTHPAPRKGFRPKLWMFLVAPIAFLLAVLILFLFWIRPMRTRAALDEILTRLRAENQPVTVEDYIKLNPPIPDTKNAVKALDGIHFSENHNTLHHCYSELKQYGELADDEILPETGPPFGEFSVLDLPQAELAPYRAAARRLVAESAAGWKKTERLLACTGSRIDWEIFAKSPYTFPLPFATESRSASEICHAYLIDGLLNKNPAQAKEAFRRARKLITLADTFPFLITHMINITIQETVVSGFQQALCFSLFTDRELQDTATFFTEFGENTGRFRKMLLEERMALYTNATHTGDTNLEWLGLSRWQLLTYDPARYQLILLRHYDCLLEVCNAPGAVRLDAMSDIMREINIACGLDPRHTPPKPSPDPLTKITRALANSETLVFSKTLVQVHACLKEEYERLTRMRLALAACAVERYRLAHDGTLPPTLDELTPALLPAVPADPFNDKPIRYRTENGGYRLWSVGRDQTDTNGDDTMEPDGTPDIVFRVNYRE